ncbi:UNVERIFIED_CONTAM: hypothetical protein PYX00_002830 [Menopon gallinae]|uniref:NADH dehydrogenase [ubiquinone] 1 alpha subcomplex assembly factor 4 n=1 Tax=Menopon gallinae TaxID=328185 RepID=A0AAW2HY52_9NEOP
MGSSVSYIRSHGKRLLNRYNAQNRAIDYLDKERTASPRHAVARANQIPEELKPKVDIHAKDLKLEEYLKEVYVKSFDPKVEQLPEASNSKRPLPVLREPNLYNYSEPEEVEKGFCTLSEVSEFLVKHIDNPAIYTAPAIATKYGLDEKKVEGILKYVTVFEGYGKKPEETEGKTGIPLFDGLTHGNIKLLPPSTKKLDEQTSSSELDRKSAEN